MYQAKVINILHRQTNISMTSKEFKNKYNRSAGNIMNRKRDNKSMRKTKKYCNKADSLIITFYQSFTLVYLLRLILFNLAYRP